MAIEITPLGFKKPDGNDPIRNGDNVIADNAQTAEDRLSYALAQLGQINVNLQAGPGGGPGISEDPMHPGTYFVASDSIIQPDPANPGFYLIGA